MTMHKSKLAIHGGSPVRTAPFPRYNSIGIEEKRAVMEVLQDGYLSGFLGEWSKEFYGGPRVLKLEREWTEYFGVNHAVAMNSGTSALYAALGAAKVGPADEVIVTPYTMTGSVTGVLLYGATPVFSDVDPETYCLSARAIEKVLSPRTKAVVVVDLFGHPADFDEILRIAQAHNLTIIEDAAQAPGGKYKGAWTGGLGHIGVFSLNYHKTIHCGEGGIAVTNDDNLAERLRLIRNHGEAVIKDKGDQQHADIIGFNYRMTEIEASIASEQLKKLEALTQPRIEAAEFLCERWGKIPGLMPAQVQPDCRHVYYVFPVQFDAAAMEMSRKQFVDAVAAEGVPFSVGYVEPLYLQPLYQNRKVSCGPNCLQYEGQVSYDRGICPVAESMHFDRLIYTDLIHANLEQADLEDVALAVEKVAGDSRKMKLFSS